MRMRRSMLAALVLTSLFSLARMVRADEGMWLYNQFPKALLKERFGFEPSDAWLDHLRLSSVRFNSGGSGSFVSSNGLVMTNHHVGADALQKLSSESRDLIKSGFYAKTHVFPGLAMERLAGALAGHYVLTLVEPRLAPGDWPLRVDVGRRGATVLARSSVILGEN